MPGDGSGRMVKINGRDRDGKPGAWDAGFWIKSCVG